MSVLKQEMSPVKRIFPDLNMANRKASGPNLYSIRFGKGLEVTEQFLSQASQKLQARPVS